MTAAAQEITLRVGPFSGTFDPTDPNGSTATRLFDAINMRVPDSGNGAAVVARMGMAGLTQRLVSSLGNATGQGGIHFRTLAGFLYTFVFAGGRMYSWDGLNTFTDVTPSGIAIDTVNPVFTAMFNDNMVVTDETNRPWVYNPSTGVATAIDIDGTGVDWCTKGGPEIYSDRVFFIVRLKGSSYITTELDVRIATDGAAGIADRRLESEILTGFQNTLVWCEPSTPLVGYTQVGYANNWQLAQTSNEILAWLAADEGTLIYARNTGIGVITGSVTSDFKSSATRDAISTVVGSNTPAAKVYVDRKVYFLDMDGRPYRVLATGGDPQPLWMPVRTEVDAMAGTADNQATVLSCARVVYRDDYQLVCWTIWDRQTIYCFDAGSGQYVGTWVIGGVPGGSVHVDAMMSLTDSLGRPCFVILGTRTSTYSSATQGVVWRQKYLSDASAWLDEATLGGATTAIYRSIETHWLYAKSKAKYRARRVSFSFLADSSAHAVSLRYMTPEGGLSAAIVGSISAVTGEKSAQDSISTARWSLGPNAQGTGLRIRLICTHTDNVQFGVHDGSVDARLLTARPRAA